MSLLSDMGVGSWFQQGPGNASSSLGKVLDQPLTYSASQATVAVASAQVLAADSTNNTRKVTLFVPSTADTGITINFGAAAVVATHFFIPAGGTLEISTLQAIHAIRNGAADVTLYILSGVA